MTADEQAAAAVERALSPDYRECFICEKAYRAEQSRWRLTCSDECHASFDAVMTQFGIDTEHIKAHAARFNLE